jgi:hypothetical protein
MQEVLTCSGVSTPDNWIIDIEIGKDEAVNSPDDDDTSYIRSNGNGSQQQFVLSNPTLIGPNDVINSVTLRARAKRQDTSDGTLVLTAVLGGNTSSGSNNTTTSAYQDFTSGVSRPGGGSWTPADLASLEARLDSASIRDTRCTTFDVLVDFTPRARHHVGGAACVGAG